jgi:small-conductance mechanosensitive channel
MHKIFSIGKILIFLFAVFSTTQSVALEIGPTLAEIKNWQSRIVLDDISKDEAENGIRELNGQIVTAESCVARESSSLIETNTIIDSFVNLAPNNAADAEAETSKSKDSPSKAAQSYIDKYTAEKNLIQQRLADCKYVEIEGRRTLKNLAALKKTEITGYLGARDEPPVMDLWRLLSGNSIFDTSSDTNIERPLSINNIIAFCKQHWHALVIFVLSVLLSFYIRIKIIAAPSNPDENIATSPLLQKINRNLRKHAPLLIPPLSIWVYSLAFLSYDDLGAITHQFLRDIFLLGVALTLVRIGLTPNTKGEILIKVDPKIAAKLSHRLSVLALLVFSGRYLGEIAVAAGFSSSVADLVSSIFYTFLLFNLIYIGRALLRFIKSKRKFAQLKTLLFVFLAIQLGLYWSGYNNLSKYLIMGLLASMVIVALSTAIQFIINEVLDGLNVGRSNWQQSIRKSLGLKKADDFPAIFWIRMISWFLNGLFLIIAFSVIWARSETSLSEISAYAVNGFELGTFRLVPLDWLTGIVIFVVFISLLKWASSKLDIKLMKYTTLDRGTRDSLLTFLFYAGFTFALLIAVSIAGVDLSKLAIIVGALSVGIGFGLQNMVNNFVSGLILLVERPIRPGDWILVNGTQGMVTKVRVRATEIRTFDRSDVIVPNSELISGQVLNWTLRDVHRRVSVNVGVAYGTNVELVKEILLKIANTHPDIVNNETFKADVLFTSFGESSLDFQLRAFVQDAYMTPRVQSELHFAIDKAFKEANIEIPFPQRDINFKNILKIDEDDIKKNKPEGDV